MSSDASGRPADGSPSMPCRISAVVCTHERPRYLRLALASLAQQTLDPALYEILVADNGRTDAAARAVTGEYGQLANLRYVREPVLGLSHARNTGWRAAQGAYVAYLDDDALADPTWLERILEVFERRRPPPGAVGGRVEPIWEAARPGWLADGLLGYLTVLDWAAQPVVLRDTRYLAGANVAYPRAVLERIGGFHPGLGRRGSTLSSNEELLLADQIRRDGYDILYDPGIIVRHHVPADRLTRGWFLRRTYWQGVSDARLVRCREAPSPAERRRRAVAELRTVLASPAQIRALVLPLGNAAAFEATCATVVRLGYIRGLLGSLTA